MHIWHLNHSSFAVETAAHLLIFDYYDGLPGGGQISTGLIDPAALSRCQKKVVVFASHSHGDHFSTKIFTWRRLLPDIVYVLSRDISTTEQAYFMGGNEELELDGLRIQTLASNDEGVAFLVRCDGETIYHAGDLNWWHWNGEPDDYNASMAASYKAQLALISGDIDVAFVPVDPRLEDKYAWGLDYFMRTVGARFVVPMHFWGDTSIFEKLRNDPRTAPYREQIAAPFGRGQQIV